MPRATSDDPKELDPPRDLEAPGPAAPALPGRPMAQAVGTALVLLGLIVLCYSLGPDAFFVLALVVVALALYEILDALKRTGRRINLPLGLACGAAMLFGAYYRSVEVVAVALGVATFGSLVLALRPGRGERPASDAAWLVLAVAWVGGGGAGAVSILAIEDLGLNLLVAYVLTTALDDIGGYFAGVKFGRHKIAPSISPAKSWEGFAGGYALALAGGAFLGWLAGIGPLKGLGIGVICGALAPVGDFAESLVKRELGIKDSGRLLPGHGGMLDRLDAIIFAAPAAYAYLELVTP